MKLKLFNRFYIFGIALMAMLYLFGVQSNRYISTGHAEKATFAKLNSLHSSTPLDQPFEVEDKEEQPETEDNESSESGISSPVFNSTDLGLSPEIAESSNDPVISRSQAEYHTPGYVRLRSILI